MSDLVLYNYFRSSASYRVRIALHYKQLKFEYRAVHLLNDGGQQNTPEYQSLNPASEVPTLSHRGHSLGQSMAILVYLDQVYPQLSLFPAEAFEKAQIIQFCEGINCTQPYQNLKTLQFLEKQFAINQEQKNLWLHRWLDRNLADTEKILEQTAGDFCFGNQVSAADCFLLPQLFSADRFGIDYQKFPNILRVQAHCQKQEAFQKAHPYRQPDTPAELKI